jgi:hypothetical protein
MLSRPIHLTVRLTRSVVGFAVSNPIARLPLRQLGYAEELGLRLFKHRLERLELPAAGATSEPADPARDARALGNELSFLLAAAVEQSTMTSEQAVFRRILSRLVPDEAAMIAALATGGPAAVVHVIPRGRRSDRPAFENASSLGRRAGVTLQRQVSTYVAHLLALGLAELGPEQPELELEFEILMAETTVRDALARAGSGVIGPRVVRQTLQLSERGRALWAACRSADGPAD